MQEQSQDANTRVYYFTFIINIILIISLIMITLSEYLGIK